MSKGIVAVIIIIIVVVVGYLVYQYFVTPGEPSPPPEEPQTLEEACIASGGTVATLLCCTETSDFPNMCVAGPCGCAPENSHEVKICDCGEGKCFDGETCHSEVTSFEQCVQAGYNVTGDAPRQCQTPDGRVFTEGGETCVAGSGASMSLFNAQEIAAGSECAEQGTIKETGVCNSETGTWWLDFEPSEPKEGCNPACVIDIEQNTAEINWRCTGLEED